MEQIIRLNFFKLTPQSFSFPVYRKNYQDGDKSDTVFRYRLPIDSQNSEYADFSVSFSQKENFELFNCKENYNINLTEHYLFRLLLNKVDNQKLEYKKGKKFFDKNIDIIIQKHQKGNEVISLLPYYLKSEQLFGFLIDFQFKMHPDFSLDKEVLQLSLSLDKYNRSNKSFYSDVRYKIESFIKDKLLLIKEIGKENNQFQITNELTQLMPSRLGKKVYRFKSDQTDLSQFQGIRKFGVYTGIEEDIKYVFVFEDKYKDFANNLYFSLIGKSNPGTFVGMQLFLICPFLKKN